jgi:hypothetical protein
VLSLLVAAAGVVCKGAAAAAAVAVGKVRRHSAAEAPVPHAAVSAEATQPFHTAAGVAGDAASSDSAAPAAEAALEHHRTAVAAGTVPQHNVGAAAAGIGLAAEHIVLVAAGIQRIVHAAAGEQGNAEQEAAAAAVLAPFAVLDVVGPRPAEEACQAARAADPHSPLVEEEAARRATVDVEAALRVGVAALHGLAASLPDAAGTPKIAAIGHRVVMAKAAGATAAGSRAADAGVAGKGEPGIDAAT